MRGKKIVGWLSRISPEAVGRAASGRYAGCESAASEVFGCIPHGARAYRESDSFAMWAVNHGVTVSMTTVSISSDPFTHNVLAVVKSEFGLYGVVGGMMVIELLTGTMRLDRGGIVAVEDDMRQTYTVKHIRKGLTLLSSAGTMRLDRGGIVAVEDDTRQAYTVKHIRKGLTLLGSDLFASLLNLWW